MDPVLSSLFPTYNIGSDGFNWFIGQVENTNDDKGGGRVRVRIVGVHHREGNVTPTQQLPFAHVMMPANVPYSNGGSAGAHNLKIGSWVIGFYLDNDGQNPIIMGSIAHTPASTYEELQEWTPDLESLGFRPTKVIDLDPFSGRTLTDINTGKNKDKAVTDAGEAKIKQANKRESCPAILAALNRQQSATNPTGSKACVAVADAKCDSKDLGSGLKRILGDLLAANQNAGGSLGSYYVGKINGELYSAVDIPRKYINKVTRLMTSFATRVKKEIVYGIREGIEALVKLIMGVQSVKQTVEQATDKPKNPKESVVPNTERGNFLKEVIKFFNKILNEIGCSFTKTLDDLIKFIVDLLMGYLQDAFNAAFCLIDNVVGQATKFLESTFDKLVNDILGPLQSLLGEAGSFLDIVGGVLNRVLNLLGISCTGITSECNKKKSECTDGSDDDKDEDENEKDFLDNLIEEIETGSLTGKTLGSVSTGVCNAARTNPSPAKTKVKFIGGILNQPPKGSYVSITDIKPEIPLGAIADPTGFPSAVPVPAADRDTENYIDYKITRLKDKIKEGEIASFLLEGPQRNGVLDLRILKSSVIPSEGGTTYEECEIASNDGLAYGLVVQVIRDGQGNPFVTINQPGVGFQVGMEFTLAAGKIGGTSEDDDIVIKIKEVGETLTYRIFGDVYDKKLIDDELYPEFKQFTFSVKDDGTDGSRTFSFQTIDAPNNPQPSYIGLEIINKRAADSIVIWDDDPEDEYRVEVEEIVSIEIETAKDDYKEGENIFYKIITENVPDGTVYDFRFFGDAEEGKDYSVYSDVRKVEISGGEGEIIVLTEVDNEFESQDETLVLILFQEDTETPVATKTVLIVDRDKEKDAAAPEFVLTQDTTSEQLQEYLDSIGTELTRDFGDQTVTLPPESGGFVETDLGTDEPEEFVPPVAGDPIVDEDGSIISIPIDYPGNKPYQIPPKVTISGDGYGAAGIALLDDKGFVSEIRVTRIGVGYVPNLPDDNDLSCIIDSFTIIRPGFGYEFAPTLYIDGDPKVAEIEINEDGYISGVRVLNRSKAYNTIPEILIVGGGGVGGFVLPSLVCLPPREIEEKGYVKIGTGRYVDCP